jgi:hypothetical protein
LMMISMNPHCTKRRRHTPSLSDRQVAPPSTCSPTLDPQTTRPSGCQRALGGLLELDGSIGGRAGRHPLEVQDLNIVAGQGALEGVCLRRVGGSGRTWALHLALDSSRQARPRACNWVIGEPHLASGLLLGRRIVHEGEGEGFLVRHVRHSIGVPRGPPLALLLKPHTNVCIGVELNALAGLGNSGPCQVLLCTQARGVQEQLA